MALSNPESFLQDNNSPSVLFRAQKLSSANSLIMALSSSASARRRLSLLFSCSIPYCFGEAFGYGGGWRLQFVGLLLATSGQEGSSHKGWSSC